MKKKIPKPRKQIKNDTALSISEQMIMIRAPKQIEQTELYKKSALCERDILIESPELDKIIKSNSAGAAKISGKAYVSDLLRPGKDVLDFTIDSDNGKKISINFYFIRKKCLGCGKIKIVRIPRRIINDPDAKAILKELIVVCCPGIESAQGIHIAQSAVGRDIKEGLLIRQFGFDVFDLGDKRVAEAHENI